MADEKDGKPVSSTDEKEDELDPQDQLKDDELEDDDEEDEDLYDKEGKPLPWSRSKRFRRIYKEAKEGRKVLSVLTDAGLSPGDLRGALDRFKEFESAYAEWQRENAAGRTTDEEDAEAKQAKKEADKIKARLKELGFISREDFEAEQQAAHREQAAANLARAATYHLAGLLEDAGIISDDMSDEDRGDIIAEWDVKVGRRISRNTDDARAFKTDHKRVISKHFKAAMSASGTKPRNVDRSRIDRLPPRVGQKGPTPPKRSGGREEEPRTIRDAVKSMLNDMKGRSQE